MTKRAFSTLSDSISSGTSRSGGRLRSSRLLRIVVTRLLARALATRLLGLDSLRGSLTIVGDLSRGSHAFHGSLLELFGVELLVWVRTIFQDS